MEWKLIREWGVDNYYDKGVRYQEYFKLWEHLAIEAKLWWDTRQEKEWSTVSKGTDRSSRLWLFADDVIMNSEKSRFIGRLIKVERNVAQEMLTETAFSCSFCMYWPIVEKVCPVKIVFLERPVKIVFLEWRKNRSKSSWSGKTPVPRERLMVWVIVGRIADKHCLKRGVGVESRTQKVLVQLQMILGTSSMMRLKKRRLVGVSFGKVWGDVLAVADFWAVCWVKGKTLG